MISRNRTHKSHGRTRGGREASVALKVAVLITCLAARLVHAVSPKQIEENVYRPLDDPLELDSYLVCRLQIKTSAYAADVTCDRLKTCSRPVWFSFLSDASFALNGVRLVGNMVLSGFFAHLSYITNIVRYAEVPSDPFLQAPFQAYTPFRPLSTPAFEMLAVYAVKRLPQRTSQSRQHSRSDCVAFISQWQSSR